MHASNRFIPFPRRSLQLAVLLIAVSVAAGCDDPTGTPAPGNRVVRRAAAIPVGAGEITREPVDATFSVECLPEPIDATGEIVLKSLSVTNRGVTDLPPGYFQHGVLAVMTSWDGVGTETGDIYHWRSRLSDNIQAESPFNDFPVTEVFISRGILTSPGSGLEERMQFLGKLTINGQDELILLKETFTLVCPDS